MNFLFFSIFSHLKYDVDPCQLWHNIDCLNGRTDTPQDVHMHRRIDAWSVIEKLLKS